MAAKAKAARSAPKAPVLSENDLRKIWDADPAVWVTVLSEIRPDAEFQLIKDHIRGRCPFHGDHNPSFYVTPHKGLAKCFAAQCSRAFLNPVQLIAAMGGGGWNAAVEILNNHGLLQHADNKFCKAISEYGEHQRNLARLTQVMVDSLRAAYRGGSQHSNYANHLVTWLRGRGLDNIDTLDIGVLPPMLNIVQALGGDDSAEARWARDYLNFENYPSWIGALVLPHRIEPRTISRLKLRQPATKDFRWVDDRFSEAADGILGIFGLPHYEMLLGNSYAVVAHVVEGEFDALCVTAAQQKQGSDPWPIFSLGGSAAQLDRRTLDRLARLNVSEVRIIPDNDDGGVGFTQIVLKQGNSDTSYRIMKWPVLDTRLDTIKDPADWVTQLGYSDFWKYAGDTKHYDYPHEWAIRQATSQLCNINSNDIRKRHSICVTIAQALTNPAEQSAFCDAAEALGIQGDILKASILSGKQMVLDGKSEWDMLRGAIRFIQGEFARALATDGELYECPLDTSVWRKIDGNNLYKILGDALNKALICRVDGTMSPLGGIHLDTVTKIQNKLLQDPDLWQPHFFSQDQVARGAAFQDIAVLCNIKDKSVSITAVKPEHRIRTSYDFPYNANAKTPLLDRYFEGVFLGDEDAKEKIACLLEFVGLCLLGAATHFETSLFLVGPTAGNGKSTFLQTVEKLFRREDRSSLTIPDLEQPSYLLRLSGKLVNISTELERAALQETALFKKVVSGEEVTAKDPYHPAVSFRPIAGHIFACNELPAVPDSCGGPWRRIRVVKFNRKIPASEVDLGLKERLAEEVPAIVSACVTAATHAIRRSSITMPSSAVSEGRERRESSDQVLAWALDPQYGLDMVGEPGQEKPRCTVVSGGRAVAQFPCSAPVLYRQYTLWAYENGHKYPLSATRLYERLSTLWPDVIKHKFSSGYRFNITIKSPQQRHDEFRSQEPQDIEQAMAKSFS